LPNPFNLIRIMPAEGWMLDTIEKPFAQALADMRAKRPLVHNITNFVVMNFTANVLLAAGASPVMAHAPEEVSDFAGMAGALVINMGTIDSGFFGSMDLAIRKARKNNVPWVLDPVGVGATRFREGIGKYLAKHKPSVIRGNASEIMALAGRAAASKGVDSLEGSDAAVDAAKRLSIKRKTVVAVTGETDYVVDGEDVTAITGGNAMSQQVTGTGCATTALVGAFLAVAPPREAAIAALQLMKHAATEAARTSAGPGSFSVALIDALAAA
jgi:hydroxyethylthiazole kinase